MVTFEPMVELEFRGRVPSAKNSRFTLPDGRSVPSSDYLTWKRRARVIAREAWRKAPVEDPVLLVVVSQLRNDLDNVVASAQDALEGVVYLDDRQVSMVVAAREAARGRVDERVTRVRLWRIREVPDAEAPGD